MTKHTETVSPPPQGLFRRLLPCLAIAAAVLLGPVQARTTADAASPAAQAQGPGATAEALPSAVLPAGIERGPSIEGVTEYRLENGLRVILAPDASKANTTVNMTYLVGSRHENYGQTGMAHLLEHMLFRGTPSLRNALAEFSRRGLAANGTTNADRTNYYATFATDPETLAWYLRWQADVMVNALIDGDDLRAEMPVVRNEMERGENSPFQMLLQQMQSTAFRWHNYGKSVIGARSDVENVDIGQLRAFYREWYQPDNALLIVSGQFDVAETLGVIADAFAPIPRPERKLPSEYTVEPTQDGERAVTLRRQGGTPLIAALYRAPATADPDFTSLELGVDILSDTPSGRLYQQLVRKNLAAEVFGFSAAQRHPAYVFFGGALEPGMDQNEALATLTETLESVADQPIQEADLERARNKWLTGWQRSYANPASLASALSESASEGDWRLYFLRRDRVEEARLEDVQRVTSSWLTASNRTSGRYIPTPSPTRAPAAIDPDIAAMLADYTGREENAAVAAFDASPANIDAATRRETVELPNGELRLALLPKPTRGGRVEARMVVSFGDAEGMKGQRSVSEAVAELLHHGTSKMSRQEIQDRYNALQASVSVNGGGNTVAISMSTVGEHLPALVDTVLHVLREADFPEESLVEYRKQMNTAIADAESQPGPLASRALARHDNPWPADDLRYTPTFEEWRADINALDRAALLAFHERYYGAGKVDFTAVGEFDTEAVRKSLQQALEGWKQAPAYTRVPDPYRPVPPEKFQIDTPDKANAVLLSALPLNMRDEDPRYPALLLANYLLGGSETSRLWTRVRVEEGLSYSVYSSVRASSYEPSGSWSLYAIHAPENSQKLERVIAEELKRVLEHGFSAEEVSEGIRSLLNFRKLGRTNDGTLASVWMRYTDLGRSFAWAEKQDEAIAALTPEQVNGVLRELLKPGLFSTAIAADHAKQKEARRKGKEAGE
ncbi:insulinase family protein [Alcaligenaceae bacterium]|nr:insulinase family protein [Alcaligenaceae bacterium]